MTDNGILTQVGGTFIADGAKSLPEPGADQQGEASRSVVMQVPHLGVVRIAYRLNTYTHGRSRRWHWIAVRADLAG